MAKKISKKMKLIYLAFVLILISIVGFSQNLLDNPESVFQAARHSVEQMDLGKKVSSFEARFSELPQTSHMRVRNIRSKHLGRFIEMSGIVRQKSDVRKTFGGSGQI